MVNRLTRNRLPGNRLRVRLPCYPLIGINVNSPRFFFVGEMCAFVSLTKKINIDIFERREGVCRADKNTTTPQRPIGQTIP